MKQKKRIVAYIRVSTPEQDKRGFGIRIQRRDVHAFAQRNRLVIDKVYADRAESGAVEARGQLQRLLRDCEQGRIDTIIIPSIDRLSRDVRIAENLFWQIENRLGIRVLISDMPNYDRNNRKDVLIRQIREAIAEENRKEIIERLWKGRRERVHAGQPAGGMVPYGYRRRRGRFVPEKKGSTIVIRIFELAGKGVSSSQIEKDLNSRGCRLRNGGLWCGDRSRRWRPERSCIKAAS
jgi:DNA invertase Pin-like site-specific DNA recombinase